MYRGTLYVRGRDDIFCDDCTPFMYQFKPDTWGIVKTPTRYYALAVYQDHLVLAGGYLPSSYTTTDQLWLTDNPQHTFKQTIPPMNTPTRAAMAITTEEHLVIAGGYDGHDRLTIRYKSKVENSGHWHSLYQLVPHTSSTLSSTTPSTSSVASIRARRSSIHLYLHSLGLSTN